MKQALEDLVALAIVAAGLAIVFALAAIPMVLTAVPFMAVAAFVYWLWWM